MPDPAPHDPRLVPLMDLARQVAFETFDKTPGSFVAPFALAEVHRDGKKELVRIDMDGLSVQDQRTALRELLPTMKALAVVVVNECWSARAKTLQDGVLLRQLQAQGRLQDAPAELRCEDIHILAESPSCEPCGEAALIENTPEGRVLGGFDIMSVNIPYPGFRRYFPDVQAIGNGEEN